LQRLLPPCFIFNGCTINIIGDSPVAASDAINRGSTDDPSLIKLTAVGILGVYEVIFRLVPCVGDYSVVSWFIKVLKKVSDKLNSGKV
jgi:hypothetical protein